MGLYECHESVARYYEIWVLIAFICYALDDIDEKNFLICTWQHRVCLRVCIKDRRVLSIIRIISIRLMSTLTILMIGNRSDCNFLYTSQIGYFVASNACVSVFSWDIIMLHEFKWTCSAGGSCNVFKSALYQQCNHESHWFWYVFKVILCWHHILLSFCF